ncbi:MAG: SOS response-associated peptidase [Bacteroidetes bacterium]|nr:SOS response-associated peptidase [Bacteroidota bacterium]
MCYSNSSTSTTQQIANRYKKEIGQVDDEPLYFANGFQFPKFRIITQEQNIKQFNWGLIPHWYRGDWKDIATKTLNAKIETLSEKKSFKNLIGRKHCLIPFRMVFLNGKQLEKRKHLFSYLHRKKNFSVWLVCLMNLSIPQPEKY